VQVKWTGGIENDLKKYIVEYSENGKDFSETLENNDWPTVIWR
jgi:hypothetical protein